jgi:hypothetical protein
MLFDTTTTDISVQPGEYSAVTSVTTSGSATLSFVVDELPAQNIENASWSANANKKITLPDCLLTVTLTGDAKFSLVRI